MVPALAERAAQKGYSLFFLGARPGVAARAAEMLQARYPGLIVADVLSPPPSSILEMDHSVVERIQAARPDILLVAFGNPKQEKWIRMHSHELHVPICIGVGGTLDMIVGVTKRAPVWMQKTGLEWLYRLAQEPKRLIKRYVQDLGYFGYFFARQWWGMRRGTALNMAPAEPITAEVPTAPEAPMVSGVPAMEKESAVPVTVLAEPSVKTSVLHIRGRLDVSNQSSMVSQATNFLERSPYLIVSLAEAEFLDSSALGALVALANRARAAGGALWIVEVPAHIANLLNLVRLDRFFEIYKDVETAESHRHQTESPVVTQSHVNGWLIIKMPRLVDAGNATEMLNRCTEQMDAIPFVVLDFSETVFLASAGMAMMIKLDRLTRDAGGALRIADCSHDVLRTLKLMKLDTILGIYPDVAIAATGEAPSPTEAATLPQMPVSVGGN
jgi:N-acetylglucosaminyldiphosphoundecaprenol N-acetyl-beta-D-mannosaminyltransferase